MRKKVLITGSSRGLGKCIALEFAKNNYDIIINYKKCEKEAVKLKEKLTKDYGIDVLVIKADISQENDVKMMINEIKETFGSIDVLVNNAGISMDNDLDFKNSEEFMKVISVNLLGTFLVTKYALDILKKGCIINIASTNGIDTPYIESVDYDASKAGVISFTHNFAKYLAPNIRVNAVAPGWIKTDMTKNLFSEYKKSEEEKILLKRFADASEIASVVFFLTSDGATYINDTVIRVDGGKND